MDSAADRLSASANRDSPLAIGEFKSRRGVILNASHECPIKILAACLILGAMRSKQGMQIS
jgi:hypothetical protein